MAYSAFLSRRYLGAGLVFYLYCFFYRITSQVSIEGPNNTLYHSMLSFACGPKAGGPISSHSFVIGPLTPRFAIPRRT
jgi:hypothetical protein